jgi:O-antigen/teichoic acid export membrane protein
MPLDASVKMSSAPPEGPAAARGLRGTLARREPFVSFVVSVGAVNASFLLGNALAFRFVDPTSMGVWHTLLLANTYLTIVRLGLVNGMGRELPFALGRGDMPRARRIASTALAFNTACCVLVALVFGGGLFVWWSAGLAWRLALPAMAVVGALNLYLAFLQATFRSDRDFARLTRLNWTQAAAGLLLPPMVYALGFSGLCLHAALQALVVTAYAHAWRPFAVAPRFEGKLAGELVATGFPLFAASYAVVLATGFDRVILLQRGTVETVGLYAPALAVLAAMAIVPGAISTWVFPRMSYALGQGQSPGALRRMAIGAGLLSVVAGLPVAALGWTLAPEVIGSFFPQYAGSVEAVRFSLLSGLLMSLSPATQVLGSLKAWPSLAVTIGVTLVARWAFPWVLSDVYPPLEGVARGNVWASAVTSALSLALVWRATGVHPESFSAPGGDA